MKFLIWIVLIVVILLLMRMLSPVKRRGADKDGGVRGRGASGTAVDRSQDADDRQAGRELMLRCKVCGVHIPSSDAVFARGRVYCGAEHRDVDAGQDRPRSDQS